MKGKVPKLKKVQEPPPGYNESAIVIYETADGVSTRQIAESVDATGMPENAEAGKKGGGIAKKARVELEEKTGRKVVTGENFLPPTRARKQIKGPDHE